MGYGKALRIFAFLGGLLAASASWTAGAQTKVTVGYTAAGDFLPVFVAKEKGYFDKHGLDVTMQRISLASTVPAALMSNSIQIGTGTGAGLVQAVDGGLDLVAVAGAARQLKSNATVSLVAKTGSGIDGAKGLEGKKVGVPGLNSVIDVVLKAWLRKNGVALDKVNFVEASFPQMNDMLRGGIVDAVAVLEPFRAKILADGNGTKVSDFFTEVKDGMIFGFWMATRKWADANPEAVKGFRAASEEGVAFIKANPDEAKAIEEKYLGVKTPGFSSFDVVIQPADIQDYINLGRLLNLVRKNPDAAKMIAN